MTERNLKKLKYIGAGLLLCIIAGAPVSCRSTEATCDRACLVSVMKRYIAALIAHNPSGLPLAATVQTVENTKRIAVGDGLWRTATGGPTDFQIYAADPIAGQVGFIGVLRENNNPTIVALRLKLAEGKITEIDHLVIHNEKGTPLHPNMKMPRPALIQPLNPSDRVSREKMYEAANLYYEAVVHDKGTIAPFTDDCQRRENGRTTANRTEPHVPGSETEGFDRFARMNCGDQIDTGVWDSITEIDNRRILVIDTEGGLVFAFSQFVHNGQPRVMNIVGVPGITEWPNENNAFDLQAAHIFKIRKARIHEIEAIGYRAPHGTKSGWEE